MLSQELKTHIKYTAKGCPVVNTQQIMAVGVTVIAMEGLECQLLWDHFIGQGEPLEALGQGRAGMFEEGKRPVGLNYKARTNGRRIHLRRS